VPEPLVPDKKQKGEARVERSFTLGSEQRASVFRELRGSAGSCEDLQGAASIFRELQDWSTESSRREVVESIRTVGSTEGHKQRVKANQATKTLVIIYPQ